MKETTVAILQEQVHLAPLFDKYEATNVRNNTNCYSHALGATFPSLQLYRVGAICGKKAVDKEFFSVEEIKNLLFLDCEALQLEIKESNMEEELFSNEFKIALFVKIWANGKIGDYHFWRYEDGAWTEKWKGRGMSQIQNFEQEKMDYFPWSFVGIYKISR